MKKYFYSVLAASMLFACSQEEIVDVNKSESQQVTFKVELPANVTSRAAGGAIGAGTQADQLIYAMYEHGVENAPVLVSGVETDGEDNDGTFTVTVPMAKDIKYDLLFLAYNPSYPAFEIASTPDSTNLKALKFNAGQTPNVDAYDAFVGFLANNGVNETKTVTLKRPFAQINAATTSQDLQDAARLGATVKQSKLVITGVPTTYNVLSEEATGSQEVTYATTDILNNETITVDGTTYTYLTLAYVLTNDDPSTHYATFEFFRENDTNPVSTLNIPNLPIQRNYRTNVVGSLVTKQGKYTISIVPAFAGTNVMDLWDGHTVKEPAYDATTEQYAISHASELAWFAAAVNGTLTEDYTRSAVAANNFAGKTFVLTEDVDLLDNEWTPIGNSSNIFKGTFDGNGKTIKNLKITGYNSNVGLFGVTHDGEIKNFTVENAKVSGRLNVGVVAGQPYTSKYSNIKVQGHVEVNGMAYVGGVGGKNAYADWTNITVNADETSYVKAHSIENETAYRTYVGGVVGFNGEGGHKFSNITSNIKVQGSTCDVGGLFGIAHYGNQFNNCVCTGDVEIYAAEEAEEAQEIGGIAGVWHNGGENVVLTNCSFSGNLSTNIEGINFYYDGLVGKPYATTGNGKLIIEGGVHVATAVELQAHLDAATGETTIYLGANINGDVTVIQKQGVKITINGLNKKYNGSIKVHSNSNHYADAALTIQNVNFETSAASVNVIEALENGSERYSQNITVQNCTFTATGEAVNTSVGVQIKSSKNAKVIDCTATDMHSLIQAQSCDETVVVNGCTIDGKNGVAFKQVKAATVEGTTITALEYGIRFDGNTDNYGIVVKNNNVTAVQPLIVRKMTGKNNTIALEGTNTLTTSAEYQIVITNGSDDAEYVKPTGTFTLTGADSYKVFPAMPKANFADNSWEGIITACQDNSVPESWKVGDKKTMTIGGKEYQIAIIGKNHDAYTAGGKAPLTFQLAEVYGTTAKMNETQTNTTGWSGSKMRNTTMGEIYEAMPDEVKNAIKEVNKETLNGTRDGLETTSDKLFLLSEIEVNGSVYFSNNFAEGTRYSYYTDLNSQIMNKGNAPATWWLRGPGKNNAIGFTQINQSGYMANGSAEYAAGVVFGFCF